MMIQQLFSEFEKIRIAVIGDVMLDTYWWGNVSRISPEAPVPIVALQKNEFRLGGAANVALNLVALHAQTTLISVIGNDEEGKKLLDLLKKQKINSHYLISNDERITTNKTRIISRNQQMMRLDAEVSTDIDEKIENQLLSNIKKYLDAENPHVIIFQDYNKGVLTKKIIEQTIVWCKEKNIITTVDPKRKNFFTYKNVDIFKPNIIEVKEGLNMLFEDVNLELLQVVHFQLNQKLNNTISFITLSEKGVFYQDKKNSNIIPTHVRNIADVSGAGDTVIAVASMVYAITKNMQLTSEVANISGGLVCEEVGTVAINKEKLFRECERLIED